MTLGIDASNARSGGITNYLVQLISHLRPNVYGFDRIIIWAADDLLDNISNHDWLEKKSSKYFSKSTLVKNYWRRYLLSKQLKEECCDVLYVPGGIYTGTFRPFVTCCMNMLPFEKAEYMRYSWCSGWRWKMILLKISHLRTFTRANGIIYLSKYAQSYITSTYDITTSSQIIHFGADEELFFDIKEQRSIELYSKENPFKILYISPVAAYKHQDILASAVAKLILDGVHIELILCGSANYRRIADKVAKIRNQNEATKAGIVSMGFVSSSKLRELRESADAYAFSSSCENMPTILIEYMSGGRPIMCSSKGPMPEFLGNEGYYYDPTSIDATSKALIEMINDVDNRRVKIENAQSLARGYSWQDCADQTLELLSKKVKS